MTSCQHLRHATAEYLDRHSLQCPANSAIQQFTVTGSGCSGNNMRYQYTCGSVSLRASTTRFSSCQELDGQQMQNLDRQSVYCSSNEVITGFQVVRTGCSGKRMRYKITCGAVTLAPKTQRNSGCQEIDHRNAEYLDRQNPTCKRGEFMTNFQVVRTGCTGIYQQYQFYCAAARGATRPLRQHSPHSHNPHSHNSGIIVKRQGGGVSGKICYGVDVEVSGLKGKVEAYVQVIGMRSVGEALSNVVKGTWSAVKSLANFLCFWCTESTCKENDTRTWVDLGRLTLLRIGPLFRKKWNVVTETCSS